MKQKINNNKNIIKLLKIKKLKIIKKTNIILKNLFFVNNRLIEINKAFFQQLDNLKNQIAKIVVPINNDSSLEQNSFGYNSDDDSDIEVLSKSAEEEDAKIFGNCCFSQNLINGLAKSFPTPPVLQKSILTS